MNDIAKRQEKPIVTVQRYFEQHKAQIQAALPKHLTPDRMARLAMTAISQSRKLAECDAASIFGSVIVASQLGLEIGVAGQGFLVPYKGKATFIPGWQGLVDLVSRSGRGSVWTGAVFAGDEFDYALGDSPYVKHRPSGENDPDRLTHTYAIGRTKDAPWPIIEVWPIERVWAHRDKNNKVGTDHYSYKHPEMYARKIPLLQVLKYMPKSIEVTTAVELSHRVDEGRRASIDASFIVVDETDDPKTPMTDSVKRSPNNSSETSGPKNEPITTDAVLPAPAQDGQSTAASGDAAVASGMTIEELERLVGECDNQDDIDEIVDMARSADLPKKERAIFDKRVEARREAIGGGE